METASTYLKGGAFQEECREIINCRLLFSTVIKKLMVNFLVIKH